MSSKKTPVVCGAIPVFEEFMTEWEDFMKAAPCLEKYIQPGLNCTYDYYVCMDDTQAYIITMHTCLLCPPALILS